MTDYKIALQLYQSQVGDENAEVKISINDITVADNVEISNTDSENPTLFVYDAADLPSPPGTTTVKVELLNDLYVDSNNDRTVYWVGCGYARLAGDGHYYRIIKEPTMIETMTEEERSRPFTDGKSVIITDWTDPENFNWVDASEYQGDENGTVDMASGWHNFAITTNYVSATISLLRHKVWVVAFSI
jgi:hypothetical protein